ncbi:MAG: hypothetical protein JOY54_09210 [Acidobacteriaceae bacterium]|nr:hypothetical protein [Acidobacteriaceae bacterium]
MTDREHADCRGRVRTCRTEREYVYADGHRVMYIEEEFSPDGDLLERRHRNPDGSEWSICCEYDERGQKREKQHISNEGAPQELFVYKYDALGRLERVVEHSQGRQRVSESIKYWPDGTKTQTSYPAPLTDEQRRTTSACGPAILHWSADTVCIMKSFDPSGRAVREVLYDADDRVIRRIAFVYDEHGRLIEEGELIGGRIREDFRHIYRYDASGRRIEADMRWGDLIGERRRYGYNSHDDPIETVIEQSNLLTDESIARSWTERSRHTYDEHGNWTERVTEVLTPNLDARVSMIERRYLIYY